MEKVDSKNIDRENKHDDAVASMAAGLEAVKHYVAEKKENDKVNNPSHYTYGQWEVIDILRGMLTPEQLEAISGGSFWCITECNPFQSIPYPTST